MKEEGADDGKPEEKQRGTARFWLRWVKDARDAKDRVTWEKRVRMAFERYEKDASVDTADNSRSVSDEEGFQYPAWFSSCKVLEPAIWSRIPELRVKRKRGVDDPIGRVMASIVNDVGEDVLENGGIESAAPALVKQFIQGDFSGLNVMFDADVVKVKNRVPADSAEEPEGEPLYDDQGAYFEVEEEATENQTITFHPIKHGKYLCTPGVETEDQITEEAYSFCLPEDEARERFGEKLAGVQWKRRKKDPDGKNTEKNLAQGNYLEGWEIWDKVTKQRYWVSDQLEQELLDQKPGYDLKGFFSRSRLISSNRGPNSIYPTPIFTHLKPLYDLLDLIFDRLDQNIDELEQWVIVDGSNDDLVKAFTQLKGSKRVLAAKNFSQLVEKGGVANAAMWAPLEPLVAAVRLGFEILGITEDMTNNHFGVPDVMRGNADPLEAVGTQQIATAQAHDRFKWIKSLVAQAVEDALRIAIEIAITYYPIEKISEIWGAESRSEQDRAMFLQALERLKNDELRCYEISIKTDSTSFVNEQLRASQTKELAATITQGIDRVAQIAQTDPGLAALTLRMILEVIEVMPGGVELSDDVKAAMEGYLQKLSQPPPEPPPPPPDYEQMKIDLKRYELDIKARQTELSEMLAQVKAQESQTKQMKDAVDMQVAQMRVQMDQQMNAFVQWLETQGMNVEQFKAQLEAQNQARDNARLEADTAVQMMEAQKPPPMPEPKEPGHTTVIINAPREPEQVPIPGLPFIPRIP